MNRIASLFASILIAASTATLPAQTAPKPAPMKVSEALQALAALRNLDGRQVVVKQSGADVVVLMPWDFANGSLRLAIASNMTILANVEASNERVRQSIVKEILKGKPGTTTISPGTPEWEEFARQYNDALAQPAAGVQGLTKINPRDLKLDVNEIAPSTLSGLDPLLAK